MGNSKSHSKIKSYNDRVEFLNSILKFPKSIAEMILQYHCKYRDTIFTRVSQSHLRLFTDYRGIRSGYESIHVQHLPCKHTYNIWLFHPRIILVFNQYGKVIKEIKLQRNWFNSEYTGFAVSSMFYLLLNVGKKQVEIYNWLNQSLHMCIKNLLITPMTRLHVNEKMTHFYLCGLDVYSRPQTNCYKLNDASNEINNSYYEKNSCNDLRRLDNVIVEKLTSRRSFHIYSHSRQTQFISIHDYWWTGRFSVDFKNSHLYHVNRDDGGREVVDMFDMTNANYLESFGNKLYLTPIGGCAIDYDTVKNCLWVFNYEFGIISRNLRFL